MLMTLFRTTARVLPRRGGAKCFDAYRTQHKSRTALKATYVKGQGLLKVTEQESKSSRSAYRLRLPGIRPPLRLADNRQHGGLQASEHRKLQGRTSAPSAIHCLQARAPLLHRRCL